MRIYFYYTIRLELTLGIYIIRQLDSWDFFCINVCHAWWTVAGLGVRSVHYGL